MASSAVIVCETSGQWAARLRCALGSDRVRLRETRRLVDCQREVAESTESLVLLEWSGNRRAELADFVDRLTRRFPQTVVLALATRDAAQDESLAREAGVIHFTSSPRTLGPVARLIRRYRDRCSSADSDPLAAVESLPDQT